MVNIEVYFKCCLPFLGPFIYEERTFSNLMTNSANLQPPPSLMPYETTTVIADIHFCSLFDSLQNTTVLLSKRKNDVEETTLAEPIAQVQISDELCSSDTEDPFANSSSDDPDFIPSDGSENVQENQAKTKTRKRKKQKSTWRRNLIKSSRNSGVEYINWKANVQNKRTIKPACWNCRNKCVEKFSEEERNVIFTKFWELCDINRQRDFISKHVNAQDKQRCRQRSKLPDGEEIPSRRKNTYTYSLTYNERTATCCKTFFLNTLSISGQMVETVFQKMGSSGVVAEDRRGKACKNSQLDVSIKNSVRNHINSFQTVESHYCRKSTARKYLPSSLNISKMYTLFQDFCKESQIPKSATESIYRQVFNTEFNLSFFQPKKDLCDTCHKYGNLSIEERAEMEEQYNLHLKNRNLSRDLKNNDKELASTQKTLCVAVFDLQQVLSVPQSNVGLAYYKLKLSTYNFTVFNLATKECQCYMWYESIAKRGSSEIGSCLLLFVQSQVKNGAKEFSFYSDNCAGQNRNKYVFALYNYLSLKYSVTIRHTFLEPGHTQSEGDSVHSVIEKASRNIPIYTPEQWYTIVRTAKRKLPWYIVHELSQNEVYDMKDLQEKTAINFDKDENNDKVYTNKFKIVKFDPDVPNFMFFKTAYDEAFRKVNLLEKGRKRNNFIVEDVQLKCLYNKKIPLTKKKYDHLMYLCEKGVITSQYHDFFKALPFTVQSDKEEEESD